MEGVTAETAGAPDTIRTCDLCLRRATLYPAELRVLVPAEASSSGKPRAPQTFPPRIGEGRPLTLDAVPEGLGLAGEAGVLGMLLLAAQAGEFAQQLLLAGGQLGRGLDEQLDHQVAAVARAQGGHAAALQPHGLAGLGSFRDLDRDLAVAVAVLSAQQARRLDLAAQGGDGHRHGHGAEQVQAVALEQFVRPHRDEDVEVAARPAPGARVALAGKPNPGAVVDAGRD